MASFSVKNLILYVLFILFSIVLVSEAQNGVGVNTNTPKSSFEDNGSFGKKVTTITANTILDDTYASIICNNGAVAIAVTLPTASTCAARVYEIKRNAASTAIVTITATIDGVVNYVLTQAGQSITVFSDGTNWLKRDGQGGEWSINGNSGTVAGTNFLGTTDAIDFVLKTSGTERLRVLSAGNIGINETAPSTILHVSQNSSTASTMPLILQNNGGSSNPAGTEVVLRLSPSSSETVRGADIAAINTGGNAIDMKFLTCNNNTPTEKVRITSLGDVGIGTIKPREKLHVSGNIQLGDSMGSVATGNRLEFSLFYSNTDPVAIYRVNTGVDLSVLRFELGDNGNVGGGASGGDFFDFCAFNTRTSPALRIVTSTGNIGINSPTPTSKLHVIADFAQTADYAGTLLSNIATNASINNVTKKGLEITSTGTWTGTTGVGVSNIGIHVSSVTGGTNNYDAIFNGGGNVGIGTATPTEYLHIFNNTAPFILLESNGGGGKTMAYKIRTWNGMAANTYVGFGGIDDGAASARAAILVPNAANTGVTEAVSILKSSGNVGIGITAPFCRADIRDDATGILGNVKLQLARTAAGDVGMAFNQVGVKSYGIVLRDNTTVTGTQGRLAFVDSYFPGGAGTEIMCIGPVPNGFVGIGCNNPQFKLHVIGDIASSGTVRTTSALVTGAITACSDIRYKKDITVLQNSLENIKKINGVNYYWKISDFGEKHFSANKQIGVIAQELEKIYPELVVTDTDGYKSVDYSRLTPILVEALKEQQKIIEKLQADNEVIKTSNLTIINRLDEIETLLKTETIKVSLRK